jgi:hypothetical protein
VRNPILCEMFSEVEDDFERETEEDILLLKLYTGQLEFNQSQTQTQTQQQQQQQQQTQQPHSEYEVSNDNNNNNSFETREIQIEKIVVSSDTLVERSNLPNLSPPISDVMETIQKNDKIETEKSEDDDDENGEMQESKDEEEEGTDALMLKGLYKSNTNTNSNTIEQQNQSKIENNKQTREEISRPQSPTQLIQKEVKTPSTETISTNSNEPESALNTVGGRRYFIAEEDTLIRCWNCGLKGHTSFQCIQEKREKPCYYCAQFGHMSAHCPNRLCYQCNMPGHYAKTCQERGPSPRPLCYRCGRNGHHGKFCFPVLRRHERPTFWCYNCGEEGHEGWNCTEPDVETLARLMNEKGDNFGRKLRNKILKKLRIKGRRSKLLSQKTRRRSDIVDLPIDSNDRGLLEHDYSSSSDSDNDELLTLQPNSKKRNTTIR